MLDSSCQVDAAQGLQDVAGADTPVRLHQCPALPRLAPVSHALSSANLAAGSAARCVSPGSSRQTEFKQQAFICMSDTLEPPDRLLQLHAQMGQSELGASTRNKQHPSSAPASFQSRIQPMQAC